MTDRKQTRAAARRAVAERLRRFVAGLTAQLTAGTAEFWAKVEARLAQTSAVRAPPSGETQQQPVQQQQQKQDEK